jgi:hypothetical protein
VVAQRTVRAVEDVNEDEAELGRTFPVEDVNGDAFDRSFLERFHSQQLVAIDQPFPETFPAEQLVAFDQPSVEIFHAEQREDDDEIDSDDADSYFELEDDEGSYLLQQTTRTRKSSVNISLFIRHVLPMWFLQLATRVNL